MIKKRFISMLVLLVAVVGAWAQEETLLTTITPTGDGTYSETTAGAVTVTPAGSFFYSGSSYGWVWDYYGSLTVTANEGYTITRCVFIQQGNNQSVTISEAPFALNFEERLCLENYSMDGVTSIEVYGTAPAAPAGYAVSLKAETADEGNWTAKAGEGEYQSLPLEGVAANTAVSVKYGGTKKVKSVKAKKKAAPAPAAPALNITSPSVGQVIGSDGKNYAYASLPTGVTAVAMIAKVSGTSGLAIALADEEGEMNYDTAVTTAAAHTPTFTGGTWRLPTQNEWKQMFASFGGDNASYSGLNTAITAAGGTGFVMYNSYCSSTVSGSNVYYAIFFSSGVDWQNDSKTKSSLLFKVRPCLAF